MSYKTNTYINVHLMNIKNKNPKLPRKTQKHYQTQKMPNRTLDQTFSTLTNHIINYKHN